MNDTWTIGAILGVITILLNVVPRIFGGGYSMSKTLAAVEARLTDAIAGSKREIEDRQDVHAREFGETIKSLREHIRQVEFHLRDNYVRRDDFADMLRVNFDNITSRLARIEQTLDHKAGH